MSANDTFVAFDYFVNLLVLLVVALPVYYVLPAVAMRRIWLVLVCAALIFYIAPKLLLLYIALWLLGFALAKFVQAFSGKSGSGYALAVAIVIALAPMVLWKVFTEEFEALLSLVSYNILDHTIKPFAVVDAARYSVIPVGLSFATFRLIDVIVQIHLGLIERLTFLKFMYFGFYPSLVPVGPIAEYREIVDDSDSKVKLSADNLGAGAMRILIGCAKIFVLAYPLAWSVEIAATYSVNTTPMVWLSLCTFAIYFWLNFSGYSDIAIGTSRLLGVKLKENFNNPYWRRNPQEFWANWHMSLTRFAQRNIFIPLGGFRKKTQYIAIFCTIMTIALWHDLSISLILFGCYHAAGLIFVRVWQDRVSASGKAAATGQSAGVASVLGDIASRVATFVFVVLSFPMLILPRTELAEFYSSLFPFF